MRVYEEIARSFLCRTQLAMGRGKNATALQAPAVQEALSSISRFLTQVGLPATARSLASELEKKGGAIHQGTKSNGDNGIPASQSALDSLLAALNPGNNEENVLASNPHDSRRAVTAVVSLTHEVLREKKNTATSYAPGRLPGRSKEDNLATIITGIEKITIPAKLSSKNPPMTSRLRGQECGARGQERKRLELSADKIRLARCQPVALMRGHREALVNLEILPTGGAQPLIFSASLDNTLRLWSVNEGAGECQAVMRAPGSQLSGRNSQKSDLYLFYTGPSKLK